MCARIGSPVRLSHVADTTSTFVPLSYDTFIVPVPFTVFAGTSCAPLITRPFFVKTVCSLLSLSSSLLQATKDVMARIRTRLHAAGCFIMLLFDILTDTV